MKKKRDIEKIIDLIEVGAELVQEKFNPSKTTKHKTVNKSEKEKEVKKKKSKHPNRTKND